MRLKVISAYLPCLRRCQGKKSLVEVLGAEIVLTPGPKGMGGAVPKHGVNGTVWRQALCHNNLMTCEPRGSSEYDRRRNLVCHAGTGGLFRFGSRHWWNDGRCFGGD